MIGNRCAGHELLGFNLRYWPIVTRHENIYRGIHLLRLVDDRYVIECCRFAGSLFCLAATATPIVPNRKTLRATRTINPSIHRTQCFHGGGGGGSEDRDTVSWPLQTLHHIRPTPILRWSVWGCRCFTITFSPNCQEVPWFSLNLLIFALKHFLHRLRCNKKNSQDD